MNLSGSLPLSIIRPTSFQYTSVREIDFSKVVLNTTAQVDEKVMLLEGWCPEETQPN